MIDFSIQESEVYINSFNKETVEGRYRNQRSVGISTYDGSKCLLIIEAVNLFEASYYPTSLIATVSFAIEYPFA